MRDVAGSKSILQIFAILSGVYGVMGTINAPSVEISKNRLKVTNATDFPKSVFILQTYFLCNKEALMINYSYSDSDSELCLLLTSY